MRLLRPEFVLTCALFMAAPVLLAQTPPSSPTFDVATIKPSRPDNTDENWSIGNNRVQIENHTLLKIIRLAYDLQSDSQIIDGPDWINKQRFDISAKIDDDLARRIDKMSQEESGHQYSLMMQALLRERFHLVARRETRPLSTYALMLNGAHSKLTPSPLVPGKDGESPHPPTSRRVSFHSGHLEAHGTSMDVFAEMLGRMRETEGRIITNQTGLSGVFDFDLNWTPEGTTPATDSPYPSFFTALREQLGPKLDHRTTPAPVVVIESATKPDFD